MGALYGPHREQQTSCQLRNLIPTTVHWISLYASPCDPLHSLNFRSRYKNFNTTPLHQNRKQTKSLGLTQRTTTEHGALSKKGWTLLLDLTVSVSVQCSSASRLSSISASACFGQSWHQTKAREKESEQKRSANGRKPHRVWRASVTFASILYIGIVIEGNGTPHTALQSHELALQLEVEAQTLNCFHNLSRSSQVLSVVFCFASGSLHDSSPHCIRIRICHSGKASLPAWSIIQDPDGIGILGETRGQKVYRILRCFCKLSS